MTDNKFCCDFEIFMEGFLSATERKKFPVALIDMPDAKRQWRKGNTGDEAFHMQWKREQVVIEPIKDAVFMSKLNAEMRRIIEGDF